MLPSELSASLGQSPVGGRRTFLELTLLLLLPSSLSGRLFCSPHLPAGDAKTPSEPVESLNPLERSDPAAYSRATNAIFVVPALNEKGWMHPPALRRVCRSPNAAAAEALAATVMAGDLLHLRARERARVTTHTH